MWLEDLRRDAGYALRTLRRSPGFAATAMATLALGIGASTAIVSVAYGVSLRRLPYPQPERLVRIHEANPAAGVLREQVSEVTFREWVRGAPSLAGAAIYSPAGTRFLAHADRQPVTTMGVSTGFFDVLGVAPALGPGFTPESRWVRGSTSEIVLSFEGWRRLFGGRPDVVGLKTELAGAGDVDVFGVVGVMPEGFAFGPAVDFWTAGFQRIPTSNTVRNWRYDSVIARLAADAGIDSLRVELETVAARLARDYPTSNRGWTVMVESLHESVVGGFGRATWFLLAAVTVVLIVTTLNVGGLLAARGLARERETTVRAALGAGVWRLRRLWLTEATVLSALGGAAGLLLAWLAVVALKAAAPPGIPRLDAVALDAPILAVAAGAAVLSVIVFSLGSLWRSERGLAERLRGTGVDAASGQPARLALTVAQCAGAAALIVLAALLTRSFVRLTAVDLGWDPGGVLSVAVMPPATSDRMPWFRYVEWSDRLVAALEATPGIQAAAMTTQVPLAPRSYPSTLARGRGRQAATDPARCCRGRSSPRRRRPCSARETASRPSWRSAFAR